MTLPDAPGTTDRRFREQMLIGGNDVPGVFTITPINRSQVDPRNLFSRPLRVTLCCMHPGECHPVFEASYETSQPQKWFIEVLPYLRLTLRFLRLAPLVGAPIAGLDGKEVAAHLDAFDRVCRTVESVIADASDPPLPDSHVGLYRRIPNVETATDREVRKFLLKLGEVDSFKHLYKVFTPDDEVLWVCQNHYKMHYSHTASQTSRRPEISSKALLSARERPIPQLESPSKPSSPRLLSTQADEHWSKERCRKETTPDPVPKNDKNASTLLPQGASSRLIRTFAGHAAVVTVQFSPDGRTLFSGGGKYEGKALGGEFSAQQFTHELFSWDVATGEQLTRFLGPTSLILSLAVSPDGRTIATGAMDGTTKLWNVEAGIEILTFRRKLLHCVEGRDWGQVDSIAFSPNGQYVLTGAFRGLTLWDVKSGKSKRQDVELFGARAVSFLESGPPLIALAERRSFKLRNTSDLSLIAVLECNYQICATAFSPDTNTQYAVTGGGEDFTGEPHVAELILWDISTRRQIRKFDGHTSKIHAVAFSIDGRHILSGSEDKTLKVWNVATGREVHTFHADYAFLALALSPDESQVVSANHDKLMLWDLRGLL